MIEITANCFDALCVEEPVSQQLGALEQNRSVAVRRFWLFLVAGLVGGSLLFVVAAETGWTTAGSIAGIAVLAVGIVCAFSALALATEKLKVPVLQRIAARAGMDYFEKGFTPPLYAEAREALFGNRLSSETFTDLFNGRDEEGRGCALYEAVLQKGSGRSRHLVFTGQVYALERRLKVSGQTVVVPDRGLLNVFKPAGGLQRVTFEEAADFEDRFEVYSSAPTEARMLLDPGLRALLLELRSKGRVHAWFGGESALIATVGKNRFEPGSMLRQVPGRERVRFMLDDACSALATLRQLRAKLG
jgi:hypothetical protein